ncbi:hypothetical protein G6F68_016988 [Rhizopus microsporus]|nr:hypothetical protein G6F68_016988 [Rhizopus microsporus]
MAAGSGSPPAAAPAGGRHASPYAPALGAAAGLDAGVAGDGRAELAAAGAADISGQRTAAGRAGSVQPDHRHRPAAVAAAGGAGQAGRAAARAQRRPGRPGGQCRAVSGCLVPRGDAARWTACRSRYRLGGAADAAGRCAAGTDPAGHRPGRQ